MLIAYPSRHTCEDLGDKQARDVVKILKSRRRPAYLTCRQLTDGALPAIGDRWLGEKGGGHPRAGATPAPWQRLTSRRTQDIDRDESS